MSEAAAAYSGVDARQIVYTAHKSNCKLADTCAALLLRTKRLSLQLQSVVLIMWLGQKSNQGCGRRQDALPRSPQTLHLQRLGNVSHARCVQHKINDLIFPVDVDVYGRQAHAACPVGLDRCSTRVLALSLAMCNVRRTSRQASPAKHTASN